MSDSKSSLYRATKTGSSNHSNDKKKKSITDANTLFTTACIKSFSPRTQYAMRRQGILPSDICYTPFEKFDRDNKNEESRRIKYEHHENHRASEHNSDSMSTSWLPLSFPSVHSAFSLLLSLFLQS